MLRLLRDSDVEYITHIIYIESNCVHGATDLLFGRFIQQNGKNSRPKGDISLGVMVING